MAILIEADKYVTHLSRYIHLNPVRAGIISAPEDFQWSSYHYYINLKKPPRWLAIDFLLNLFGQEKSVAKKKYREFVGALAKGNYESPLKKVFASTILGSSEFVEYIREEYLPTATNDRNVPALTKLAKRKTIEEILVAVEKEFNDDQKLLRKASLYICHHYSGRKLKDIGKHFNIGESAVSQTSTRFATILLKDSKLQKQIKRICKELELLNV